MNSTKYIGMDVHKEATTIAVMKPDGKLVMESIVETKAATIVQFLEGLRGELYVTFEEGTWAAWWYDLLKPHVTKVVVCNPRKNASGFPTTCPHSLADRPHVHFAPSRSMPSSSEVRIFGRENLTASYVSCQRTSRKDLVVRDGHNILRENYKISKLAGLD